MSQEITNGKINLKPYLRKDGEKNMITNLSIVYNINAHLSNNMI